MVARIRAAWKQLVGLFARPTSAKPKVSRGEVRDEFTHLYRDIGGCG